MKKSLFCLIFIIALSGVISAQTQNDEYNKIEVYSGYSRTFEFTLNENDSPPIEQGFNTSIVYNVTRYIGVKADVSGTYKKLEGYYYDSSGFAITPSALYTVNTSLYSATAGVQFKDNSHESFVKPYGHLLVGYGKRSGKSPTVCPAGAVCPPVHYDFTPASGVSTVIGGGLDLRLNRKIDFRVFQIDINPITGKQGTFLNTRVGTGIIFKF